MTGLGDDPEPALAAWGGDAAVLARPEPARTAAEAWGLLTAGRSSPPTPTAACPGTRSHGACGQPREPVPGVR